MTYTTYQAAKIANPESEILKARDDWEGCQELIGKFIANKPNPGGEPYIGKGWFEICNPADYCMTVKQFLDAGHKLFAGDIYLCREVGAVTIPEGQAIVDNTACDGDDKLYVLKAKELEETKPETKPTYRYEKVKDSIFDLKEEFERGELFYSTSMDNFALVRTEHCFSEMFSVGNLYRRIEVTERDEFVILLSAFLGCDDYDIELGQAFDTGNFKLVNGKV